MERVLQKPKPMSSTVTEKNKIAMDEIQKLNELVSKHKVIIKMNTIGCSWLSTLAFDNETLVHHFASKNLKDLFSGMIEQIENKYKAE